MKTTRTARLSSRFALISAILVISILAACSNLPEGDTSSESELAQSLQQTVNAQQVELSVQSTLAAQSALATLNAAAVQPTAPPPVDYAATQAALNAQATSLALQAASLQAATLQAATLQPAVQPPTETPTLVPPPPPAAETVPDLEAFMDTASILLYEDMVANTDTIRYVKRTLDEMGLKYVDTGNAIGNFKSQLLTGGPQGQGWDLVIIASEAKSGASGEFFQYAMDALDAGSSVIYEVWFLDEKMGANGYAFITRCGLDFYRDWSKVPPERMVMFPVNTEHPIMHEPNDGLTFTKVTDYWAYIYDIGDLMRKSTVGGDATILVGTLGTDPTGHGTVTVCVNDQLILQTFSSHQLSYDVMRRVWENYIYHGLKTRMLNLIP